MFRSDFYSFTRFLAPLLALTAFSSEGRASFELSSHFRGLSPDAGGVDVLGARGRWNWAEVSLQAFEGESLAYSLALVKPFVQQGSFLASIGAITLNRNNTRFYGSTLGFRWNPIQLSSFGLGLRLDNELLYELRSKSLQTEYFVGVTLNWR